MKRERTMPAWQCSRYPVSSALPLNTCNFVLKTFNWYCTILLIPMAECQYGPTRGFKASQSPIHVASEIQGWLSLVIIMLNKLHVHHNNKLHVCPFLNQEVPKCHHPNLSGRLWLAVTTPRCQVKQTFLKPMTNEMLPTRHKNEPNYFIFTARGVAIFYTINPLFPQRYRAI